MPTSSPDELSSGTTRPRHAGVWVRVAANVLDVIILGAPVLLLFSLILDVESSAAQGTVSLADFYNVPTLLQMVILTVITILLWVNWDGRTPGKKLLSPNPPKDTDGRREDSGRGWVRELQGRWPGVLG